MTRAHSMYIHPASVRVWHWINAAGFILLVVTGFQIRFAEMLNLFSLQNAIKIHNFMGFVIIANYLLWLSYYFGSGRIGIYFPDLRTFPARAARQLKYYGCGIFRGEPNPHIMTPENKFNPLQQKAYLGLMFVFLPAQIISGLFLWKVNQGFRSPPCLGRSMAGRGQDRRVVEKDTAESSGAAGAGPKPDQVMAVTESRDRPQNPLACQAIEAVEQGPLLIGEPFGALVG